MHLCTAQSKEQIVVLHLWMNYFNNTFYHTIFTPWEFITLRKHRPTGRSILCEPIVLHPRTCSVIHNNYSYPDSQFPWIRLWDDYHSMNSHRKLEKLTILKVSRLSSYMCIYIVHVHYFDNYILHVHGYSLQNVRMHAWNEICETNLKEMTWKLN